MFDTAAEVLSYYLDTTNTIRAIALIAQPSLDEFYYLCTVGDDAYAIYQTDHPTSLSYVANEIKELLHDEYKPFRWVVRHDHRTIYGGSQSLDATIDDEDGAVPDLINALFYSAPNSYWRYAVLKLAK